MTSNAMEISTAPLTASTPSMINEMMGKASSVKTLENALAALVQNQIKNDSCIYCGNKLCINSTDSGSATTPEGIVFCNDCKLAKYCSDEHQKADYPRHKQICHEIRTKMASISSSQGSTSSSVNSPPSAETTSRKSEVTSTSDPDIQIIESTSATKNSLMEARFARKRALNPHIQYKDHSKNPLFKSTLQDHMRSLAASGLALNQHQAIALRLRYLAEHVIRGLNEYGWAVCDHFLGDTHCSYTYREVERLYGRGLFSAGQLMDRKDNSQLQDIRSDQIYWFDGSDERARDSVTVRLLISMIDSVIVHFRDRIPPYSISGRSRAMIACYPGNGTRYVKHVDNPVRDGRCITSIYYCNEDWKLSEHGGTLRLYPETSLVPMDIDPQADRLVFFWSDRRNPHEVLPVFRHRYAITIWYFDHAEKMEALERRRKQESSSSSTETTTSSSPSKSSRAPALGEWQSRPSAFKPVATSNFVLPKVPITATASTGATAGPSSSSSFIVPRSHMVMRTNTNSDSFSTGSAEDNLDDELPIQQPDLKPEYQI